MFAVYHGIGIQPPEDGALCRLLCAYYRGINRTSCKIYDWNSISLRKLQVFRLFGMLKQTAKSHNCALYNIKDVGGSLFPGPHYQVILIMVVQVLEIVN